MNRDPKNHHEGDSKGGGGRGLGGPPLGVKYGGMAQQVYTPPSQRSSTPTSAPAKAAKSTESAAAQGPAKKMAASRSRYGSIAPMKPLVKAPIFESALTLNLDAKSSDGDWAKYAGSQKLPDAPQGVVNGVYIHRSQLPTPPPQKIKVKFEPA